MSTRLLEKINRDPLAGSFCIRGVTGQSEQRINGTFEPTRDSQLGFPVYKKKGNSETWVEMVYTTTAGWRWYLKPTANKGPDSTVCFAYAQCDEDDIKLPQDCASWCISTKEGFKQQASCVVSLAIDLPVPKHVSSRLQDGLNIARKRKDDRIAEVSILKTLFVSQTPSNILCCCVFHSQETRGVIAGTFRLDGATGKSEGRFNGVFEPSDEIQNNFPVYKKKGDPDTWIELVKGISGWRWYLKPTANKGPDSSVCFAYHQCDETNIKLPSEYTTEWHIHTASGFVIQPITVTLESTAPLPERLQSAIKEGKAILEKAHQDKVAEQTRGAVAGSFHIEGATGKSAIRTNGTFEPTIEAQCGFPVYKKKWDGEDTWVEMVYKTATGWRWYLKPTANKGPDSAICFAYAQCNEDDIKLPSDLTHWMVSTSDGFVMQSTVKLSRSGPPDTQDILNRFSEGKNRALKIKNDRVAEENRGAVKGSFRIAGAVGKSASRTNGVFEPTHETQNGMPVYQKKGDVDTWMELVHAASGHRWYVKPTVNKGPESSICFTYYNLGKDGVKLPLECTENDWVTNTVDGFKPQSSIKVTAVGEGETQHPEHLSRVCRDERYLSFGG
jgi:hypothetical protein